MQAAEQTQNKLLKTPMFLVFRNFLNSIFFPTNELNLTHYLNCFVRNASENVLSIAQRVEFWIVILRKTPIC